jgi:NADPH:quinone reductase-like Zn-dependent oxidoreductase
MAGDAAQAQTVLLLHGPRQAYQITNDYPVPRLVEDDETLIRTHTIGLNPIDWKAPYEESPLFSTIHVEQTVV